jgi:lipopolysaccharide/colanic/teichoic acid biosynthesis glycosyltransferase
MVLNNGSAFFIQKRAGKNGKTFKILKFKTMNEKKDLDGKMLHDSLRLTSFGRVIRSLSIDELPQFINVLAGNMSLIGPRPLLVEYLPLYDDIQARRHEVKPGITGWAQVNGRKGITFSKRFELDVWYVDHVSLKLDIKIILLTISKLIKRENNPPGKLPLDVDDVGFRKRLGIEKSMVS